MRLEREAEYRHEQMKLELEMEMKRLELEGATAGWYGPRKREGAGNDVEGFGPGERGPRPSYETLRGHAPSCFAVYAG